MSGDTGDYEHLLRRVREIVDLDAVLGLLGWDEETYAPEGARAGRGRQLATLEAIRHRLLLDPVLGGLMEGLLPQAEAGSEQAVLLDLLRRKRDQAERVPEPLVRALAEARSRALFAWETARRDDDYRAFAPHLGEVLRLSRERGAALSAGHDPYDALLDEHEPGVSQQVIGPVLDELRRGLVPLLQAIAARPQPQCGFLSAGPFAEDRQWRLCLRVLSDLGLDLRRGRLDRSHHPFTQVCGDDDVRMTTRLDQQDPFPALFATIHEAGHALYDQGFQPGHHGTFLADAPSTGLHESQARLWENQVARSSAFLRHYQPVLAQAYPQFQGVPAEALWRAVNRVAPGCIRVKADEVTYNLHILLRYDLEVALLRGDLPVADLPASWNEMMRAYLGIVPDSDSQGCLQDVHWALGAFGYFPTYAIGNLYAAQLMAAYEQDHPALWQDIERGEFAPLLHWLREKVHRRGHLLSAEETIRQATGTDLTVGPFLSYLRRRYGEVYGLADLGPA